MDGDTFVAAVNMLSIGQVHTGPAVSPSRAAAMEISSWRHIGLNVLEQLSMESCINIPFAHRVVCYQTL